MDFITNLFGFGISILFGSYARGSATENSDIDILLELQKPVTISLLDIATMQIELSEQLKRSVDILTSEGISIDREKVLVYPITQLAAALVYPILLQKYDTR